MNMNWYLNQELGAEHRRELMVLRGATARNPRRRWHLPHVAVTHRRSDLPRPTMPREVCD
jgi:hypothetical protein